MPRVQLLHLTLGEATDASLVPQRARTNKPSRHTCACTCMPRVQLLHLTLGEATDASCIRTHVCESTRPPEAHMMHVHVHALYIRVHSRLIMGLVCESTCPPEAHMMHVHVHALYIRVHSHLIMGLVCESTRPPEAHTMHVHVHALHVRMHSRLIMGLVCKSTRPPEAHTMTCACACPTLAPDHGPRVRVHVHQRLTRCMYMCMPYMYICTRDG